MIPLKIFRIEKLVEFNPAGTTAEVAISTDKNEVMNGSSGDDEMLVTRCWAQFVPKVVMSRMHCQCYVTKCPSGETVKIFNKSSTHLQWKLTALTLLLNWHSVTLGHFFNKLHTFLSGIRQKSEFQNGCFKKAKLAKISEKQTFLTPRYAHACKEVRNVCFSEILACFDFLKHPFWDSPFCLITDVLCQVFLLCVCQKRKENIQ